MAKEQVYPGERQPRETNKAWEAFVCYRDMGLVRSYEAVGRKLGKSGVLIGRWAHRYDWKSRADAWDAFIDEQVRTAQVDAIKQMSARHAELAVTGLKGINAIVEEFVRRVEEKDLLAPKTTSNRMMSQLFLSALYRMSQVTKVERASRGLPDLLVALQGMTDDELADFFLTEVVAAGTEDGGDTGEEGTGSEGAGSPEDEGGPA